MGIAIDKHEPKQDSADTTKPDVSPFHAELYETQEVTSAAHGRPGGGGFHPAPHPVPRPMPVPRPVPHPVPRPVPAPDHGHHPTPIPQPVPRPVPGGDHGHHPTPIPQPVPRPVPGGDHGHHPPDHRPPDHRPPDHGHPGHGGFNPGHHWGPPAGAHWGWHDPMRWNRGWDVWFFQQSPNYELWRYDITREAQNIGYLLDTGNAAVAANQLQADLISLRPDRYAQNELLWELNNRDRKGVGSDLVLGPWNPVIGGFEQGYIVQNPFVPSATFPIYY